MAWPFHLFQDSVQYGHVINIVIFHFVSDTWAVIKRILFVPMPIPCLRNGGQVHHRNAECSTEECDERCKLFFLIKLVSDTNGRIFLSDDAKARSHGHGME
jgi:hypothetical protein